MYVRRQAGDVPALPNFGEGANDNHGGAILAITGSTTAFACILILARIHVRAVILKTFGADDWAMLVAMACSASAFALFVTEVKLGVGEHSSNPQLLENINSIVRYLWFHTWIMVLGISFVKISVGFFLLRLVQGKLYKRSIIAWIIFLFLFTLVSMGTLIFECLPVRAAWDQDLRLQPKTKCFTTRTFLNIGLFNGAINLFTDFVFATLPIPIILPLQINLGTKISLITVLSLGYFACAASIVKEVLLGNLSNTDPFFNFSLQVWYDIELNTGIIAACLPALRPLFAFFLDTANTMKSNGIRRTILGTVARHRHEIRGDTKMSTLPTLSVARDHGNQGYGVIVSGGDRAIHEDGSIEFRPTSKLEQSITESDRASEEDTSPRRHHRVNLPPAREQTDRPRGILRTTEVTVS